ncbi:hypothetical protein [Agromyces sp. NPDC058104]|uniref:hypothetical protein n=1 Tax=Agromyces sp. NPDC058104 TaxID=3346342 RepID=UPI0036DF400B
MTNPRYIPRSFCKDPDAFGLVEQVEWHSVPATSEVEREAAVLQHRVAHKVRRLMRTQHGIEKVSALASAIGAPYDRLQKVLSGRVVMRLEDIARFRLAFGTDFDVAMMRTTSTTPPARLPRRVGRP